MTSPFDGLADKRPFGSAGNTQFLVSLYLIIMAFFIILSSLGERGGDQAASTLDGVRASFDRAESRPQANGGVSEAGDQQASDLPAHQSESADRPSSGRSSADRPSSGRYDTAYQQLTDRMIDLFQLPEGKVRTRDSQLEIELPYTPLFRGAAPTLTEMGDQSVAAIADDLASLAGVRLQTLHIFVPVRDESQTLVAQQQRRITRRQGASLVRALESRLAGLRGAANSPPLIAAGFQARRPRSLILLFDIALTASSTSGDRAVHAGSIGANIGASIGIGIGMGAGS